MSELFSEGQMKALVTIVAKAIQAERLSDKSEKLPAGGTPLDGKDYESEEAEQWVSDDADEDSEEEEEEEVLFDPSLVAVLPEVVLNSGSTNPEASSSTQRSSKEKFLDKIDKSDSVKLLNFLLEKDNLYNVAFDTEDRNAVRKTHLSPVDVPNIPPEAFKNVKQDDAAFQRLKDIRNNVCTLLRVVHTTSEIFPGLISRGRS